MVYQGKLSVLRDTFKIHPFHWIVLDTSNDARTLLFHNIIVCETEEKCGNDKKNGYPAISPNINFKRSSPPLHN